MNQISPYSVDVNISSRYIPRKRIEKIFDQATRGNLVYVIAGAGYGKTEAARHYVEKRKDTLTRWMQLTESDNISSNFWEHMTRNISANDPGLAVRLRELGFPDTLARFKQFTGIVKDIELRARKTFLVLDDFHVIHSRQVLTFAERYLHWQAPGVRVIIISRTAPEINTVSLLAKGKASVITEDDLCFTQDEIAEFLRYRGIAFLSKDIPVFFEATRGWALAVQLLSMVLKRVPDNLELALSSMKQNIFKLFETEAFNDLPESAQKIITRAALVYDLPLSPLRVLSGDASFLQNNPMLTSFMWFDDLSGDYRIHPLYQEFLRSKHDILNDDEKLDTYRQAARWCWDNEFYIDATRYFAKSRQYDRMLEVLLSYPFKLPYDTCEFFLRVLDEVEPVDSTPGDSTLNYSVLLLKSFFAPIFLMGTGRYEEARQVSLDTIKKWERSDAPFSKNLLYACYSNLAYIDMYTCTFTRQYDAPKYLMKSVEYFKLASIPPVKVSGTFSVPDIRSFACLVGEGAALEEFDQFLEASRQTAFYIGETFHDMYYGYDDLVACEIDFHKNKLDSAKKYAHQAIAKAREKKQYSIEAMAEQYLLRITLHEGDYPLTKILLEQLRGHLDNPNFWNRQMLHDLFLGLFYSQIGLPKMSPQWMLMDEKEANSEVRIPTKELLVSVSNYIALKKYDQAITVLNNSCPREPQERFLFGELKLSLLAAVAKIKTDDTPGAMDDFARAYALSFEGVFEMAFIELGKDLRPLVLAAAQREAPGRAGSDHDGHGQLERAFPAEWLRRINRKASVYAKKAAFVASAYKRDNNIEETISLSERELEILRDLYHGLTRDEIAENRYLAVPTVKKILQSIYTKLDASNNVDAIRIAIEQKLID